MKMFGQWLREVGISRASAARYRKIMINGEPMLAVSGNINGHLFVTEEDVARFWARAKKGEFAKTLKPPARSK